MSEVDAELLSSQGLPPEMQAYLDLGASPLAGIKRKLHGDSEGDENATGDGDDRMSEVSLPGSGSFQNGHYYPSKRFKAESGARSVADRSSEGITDDFGWAADDDGFHSAAEPVPELLPDPSRLSEPQATTPLQESLSSSVKLTVPGLVAAAPDGRIPPTVQRSLLARLSSPSDVRPLEIHSESILRPPVVITSPPQQSGESALQDSPERHPPTSSTTVSGPNSSSGSQASALVREKSFREDPCVDGIEPARVKCAMCGSWLKLSGVQPYDPHNWDVHKQRCKSRDIWIQSGNPPPVVEGVQSGSRPAAPSTHSSSLNSPPRALTPVELGLVSPGNMDHLHVAQTESPPANLDERAGDTQVPGPLDMTPSTTPLIKSAPRKAMVLGPLFTNTPLGSTPEASPATAVSRSDPTGALASQASSVAGYSTPIGLSPMIIRIPAPTMKREEAAGLNNASRMTEDDRRRVIENDPDVRESRPDAVLCNMCSKWIKLSNTQPYAFGNWSGQKGHKIRCRERNPHKTRDFSFNPGGNGPGAIARSLKQYQFEDPDDDTFIPTRKLPLKVPPKQASAFKPTAPGVRSSSRVASIAAQAEAALREDPRVRSVQEGRAQCNGCGKWVKVNNFTEHSKYRCHKAWSKNGKGRNDDDDDDDVDESNDEEDEEDESWNGTRPATAANNPPAQSVAEDISWWRRRTPTPPPPRPSSPQPDYIGRYSHYLAPNAAYICAPGIFSYTMIRPSPWLPGSFATAPAPSSQIKATPKTCPFKASDDGDKRLPDEIATAGLVVPPPALVPLGPPRTLYR
ncbi:hypothetical protein BKA62DRAFT_764899 [Auriculariales sp. MPI-PUGE-AT-0066]|nr:hypothetical protein BKA62DRAFT_764899 [Auriculariales sp. MPI-PUGE-AT-0066]